MDGFSSLCLFYYNFLYALCFSLQVCNHSTVEHRVSLYFLETLDQMCWGVNMFIIITSSSFSKFYDFSGSRFNMELFESGLEVFVKEFIDTLQTNTSPFRLKLVKFLGGMVRLAIKHILVLKICHSICKCAISEIMEPKNGSRKKNNLNLIV